MRDISNVNVHTCCRVSTTLLFLSVTDIPAYATRNF